MDRLKLRVGGWDKRVEGGNRKGWVGGLKVSRELPVAPWDYSLHGPPLSLKKVTAL